MCLEVILEVIDLVMSLITNGTCHWCYFSRIVYCHLFRKKKCVRDGTMMWRERETLHQVSDEEKQFDRRGRREDEWHTHTHTGEEQAAGKQAGAGFRGTP